MNPIKALLAAIPALAVAGASLVGAGAAAAAPRPTPNQLTGAANMVNANALPGMLNAMTRNNGNGDAGMWCAVYITNGVTSPGSCR
jgi:hypothetical protein